MRRLLDTNLMGAIFCSKAALKHMLRRREGSIVNIGDVFASEAVCFDSGSDEM